MRPRMGPPMPLSGRTRGEYREVFRAMPGGEVLLIGRSIARDIKDMQALALRLVVAGAGVLLLGLAGGWWLATRAIRPIEDIGATALKIAAGDLSQRINVADTDSELGRLASVLNSTFSRLEAAFAHQARFTSDASHELRTPVSVVLTQTQTALARERDPAEYREALEGLPTRRPANAQTDPIAPGPGASGCRPGPYAPRILGPGAGHPGMRRNGPPLGR